MASQRQRKPRTTTPKSGETGRQRYNKMVRVYKQIKSAELGISQRKVLVRGNSESAQLFKQFYKLITNPNKPENWKKQLGDMGFGRAFWVQYMELSGK